MLAQGVGRGRFSKWVSRRQFFDILIHQGDKLRLAVDIVGQRRKSLPVDNQPTAESRTLAIPGFKNISDGPSNTGLPFAQASLPHGDDIVKLIRWLSMARSTT